MVDKAEGAAVTDLIEGETVKAPASVDMYVLLINYGNGYWSPLGHCLKTAEEARDKAASYPQHGWRIVRVRGLPVDVPPKECA